MPEGTTQTATQSSPARLELTLHVNAHVREYVSPRLPGREPGWGRLEEPARCVLPADWRERRAGARIAYPNA
jgi:hypothetical protein